MKKNLAYVLLLLALSIPLTVFADTEEEVSDAVETEVQPDETSELESGNGWKTVLIAELGKSGKKVHMVLVEQRRHTDKTVYSNAISRLCQGEDEFCRVRFWSDARYIPERAALTAAQNKQLKADYLFNKTAGIRELRWSCGVDPNSQNCLP
ncbi:hypothetical protein [Nitrosomonas sp.]|uniref:hypothetical protein n=1 Tax=Nitrosomonas sp. TaxID=42353 RepID=UPI001D419E5A|nr:hypothetical protein [Nitrosomonas sp.]MCB1948631.1 hypothetical protein [Nitrosomonas sp.]MCP5243210.1 hypothetical protein [Burkholderiales bacterium]MDR4513987.1 hypothetical protein [Nitrosomonas sp.]